MSSTDYFEDLVEQLRAENPGASEKQLLKIRIRAIRDDDELAGEAIDWFFKENYPAAKAAAAKEGVQ